MDDVERRFLDKVDRDPDGCWLWTAGLRGAGYGHFRAEGGKLTAAHRWSYARYVGPIPAGMEIDHLCRNRRCVRPEHLEAVTHAVNLQNRQWGASGVRNVSWNRREKAFKVAIRRNGQTYNGGSFDDLADAARAASELRAALL